MSSIYKFSNYEDAAQYASNFRSKDIIIYVKSNDSYNNSYTYSYSYSYTVDPSSADIDIWHVEVIGQDKNLGNGAYIEVPTTIADNKYKFSYLYETAYIGGYEWNGHRVSNDSNPKFDDVVKSDFTINPKPYTSDYRHFLASRPNTSNISYYGY